MSPKTIETNLGAAIKSGYAGVQHGYRHRQKERQTRLANEEKERIRAIARFTEMLRHRQGPPLQAFSQHREASYSAVCSTGGGRRTGRSASQLSLPGDYDGILAGAPQKLLSTPRIRRVCNYQLLHSTDRREAFQGGRSPWVYQNCHEALRIRTYAPKEISIQRSRECWFGVEENSCEEGDDPRMLDCRPR